MKKLALILTGVFLISGCDDASSGDNNSVNNTTNNTTNNSTNSVSNNTTNNITNNINPCAGVDCSGHGSCTVSDSQPVCNCDDGYEAQLLSCVSTTDPCLGITCSGHGDCVENNGLAVCNCDDGYENAGVDSLECITDSNECSGIECSGHGECTVKPDGAVCICETGYTPSTRLGLDCVPTATVCTGGEINYDIDLDGVPDTWFEPIDTECEMFELINLERAVHDAEGTPECHKPLLWSVEWAAHGRNHSIQMENSGGLFHEDYPYAQNCAYGCGPECEMDMYMNGTNEGHCPPLSHHCNIMRCDTTHVGVGFSGTWNTQNFF
ncbi:MAG: hypothetical protein JXR95_14135 [Deltaproteobacteria bacterium]|nr:hypothetical protein [Deltaproteobacteria bacterium]